MNNLTLQQKSKYVVPSLIDEYLLVSNDDGTYYIASDITIMKELSGRADKFTPAQIEAIQARAALRPSTKVGDASPSDSDIISNIVPREFQTLNEKKQVSEYFKNEIVSKDKRSRQDQDLQDLKDRIINGKTD